MALPRRREVIEVAEIVSPGNERAGGEVERAAPAGGMLDRELRWTMLLHPVFAWTCIRLLARPLMRVPVLGYLAVILLTAVLTFWWTLQLLAWSVLVWFYLPYRLLRRRREAEIPELTTTEGKGG